GATVSTAGDSLTTLTVSPPAGAGCSSRTLSVPARFTPTTFEPNTASSIRGGGSTAVAVMVSGARPATVAVMAFAPGVAPRIQLPSVALPAAFVVTVAPVSVPPPETTANVTGTSASGVATASV